MELQSSLICVQFLLGSKFRCEADRVNIVARNKQFSLVYRLGSGARGSVVG
jgi:hypothetical protein